MTTEHDRPDLDGRRILVVGASSGIGAALAAAAVSAGAHVAAAARRADRLEALAEAPANDGGPGRVLPVPVDVRSASSVAAMVDAAIDGLGGLDAVVYATGVNHLALLEDTSAEAWRMQFETNVVGASLVTAAALPALRSSNTARVGSVARIAYLSSHSVPRPWPGLSSYAATKAALETMIEGWRVEEPDVAFTRVIVGPTMTPMAEGWDRSLAATFFERWESEGYFENVRPVTSEVVAAELVAWLAAPTVPHDLAMPNLP